MPAWFDWPGDRELGPRDALHAGDRADRHALGFEHRALLDVQLDVRVRRRRRARLGPGVTDAHQLVAEHRAVDRADRERLLERHAAREHEAAEHVGREPAALLVGEERDRERVLELDAGARSTVSITSSPASTPSVPSKRPPVATVSMWLPVSTGGSERVGRPGADDVADLVDVDPQAEIAHPGDDEVAAAGGRRR